MSRSERSSPLSGTHDYFLDGRLFDPPRNSGRNCQVCGTRGISVLEERVLCSQHSVQYQILKQWLMGTTEGKYRVFILHPGSLVESVNGRPTCANEGCNYYGDLIPGVDGLLYCGHHLDGLEKRYDKKKRNDSLAHSSPIPRRTVSPDPVRTKSVNSSPLVPKKLMSSGEVKPMEETKSLPQNGEMTKSVPTSSDRLVMAFRENRMHFNEHNLHFLMFTRVTPQVERYFINAIFFDPTGQYR